MRKFVLLGWVIFTIFLVGCTGKPNRPDTGNNPTNGASINFVNCDLVVLVQGQMQFYDGVQQKLMPFPHEKDSVVNALFTNQHELFYTISTKNGLVLKRLDLSKTDPKPEHIADWNLPMSRCIDERGGAVSSMWLSDDGIYIGIQKDFSWDAELYGFTDMSACRIEDGAVFDQGELEAQDYSYLHFFHENLPYRLFEQRGRDYYYVSSKEEHCLTDQLNYVEYLKIEDGWELDEIDFMPIAFSPDGNSILFTAIMPWGDFGVSTYCVSTLDGSRQRILEGSDSYDISAKWLSNGSIVFASFEMASEDDPEYENYWQGQKPCLRILDPNGNTKLLCEGNAFATKPLSNEEMVANKLKEAKSLAGISDCEMAIFNHGKLCFYNAQERSFHPLDNEPDSVINGTFVNERFYYCTAVNGRVFLKCIRLANPEPELIFDMNLDLDKCITETYGDVSSLHYYPDKGMVGIWHDFSWDGYDFTECTLYDWQGDALIEWDHEEDLFSFYEDDDSRFEYDDFENMDGQYYYKTVCLTDQMDLKKYADPDPDYAHEPDFWGYDANPDGTMICFYASVTTGDFDHGPICVASIDGKFQKDFEETDFCTDPNTWLSDGSFVYASGGQITIMYPDRKIATLCKGSDFVIKRC